MRRAGPGMVVVAALLVLTGCDSGPTPEEQAQADARDVAMVEAANEVMPPVKQVTPEPLLLPDIERYDLYGQSCNYAPGTSLGARVIAREADAFVKIDGEVHRLAADPGSRELPMHTRTLYSGKEYSMRLSINDQAEAGGEGPANLEGSISVRDRFGRVVYEGTGPAQCKG